MSEHERTLETHLMALATCQPFEREYKFHPSRKWRFDFAWPAVYVAAEVEGGLWIKGRHNRAEGFRKDCEKYNEAVLHGWRVLRFTPEMVESGEAVNVIERMLKEEGWW